MSAPEPKPNPRPRFEIETWEEAIEAIEGVIRLVAREVSMRGAICPDLSNALRSLRKAADHIRSYSGVRR